MAVTITTRQQMALVDIYETITDALASNSFTQIEALFASNFFGTDHRTERGFAFVGEAGDIVLKVERHGDGSPESATHNSTHGYEPLSWYLDETNEEIWVCLASSTTTATWIQLGVGGGGEAIYHHLTATQNPSPTWDSEDGYTTGSMVVNTDTSPNKIWLCIDPTAGSAVWICLSDNFNLSGTNQLSQLEEKTELNDISDFVFEYGGTGRLHKIPADRLLNSLFALSSNLDASRDPRSDDSAKDGYSVLSFWINKSSSPYRVFICTESGINTAQWVQINGGGSSASNFVVGTTPPVDPTDDTIFIEK